MGPKIGAMSDLQATLVVFSIGAIAVLVLYVFSSFRWEIVENTLFIKWGILKYIPLVRRKISVKDIQEARRFELRRDVWGGYVFGVFRRGMVVLVLRRRLLGFGFAKKVFFTPDDPDKFLEELRTKAHL